MASKKASSAKKSSSKKPKSKSEPRAGVGHNGQINKEVVKILDQYMSMEDDKKQIGKAQRDLRAKAKEQHGVQSDVFSHEIRLRKMDSDRRVMFETGHNDLKNMIGYQMSLAINAPEEDDGDGRDPEEVAAEAAA